ncbi:Acetyl-coenzyme A transporter 1, putative [Angomonas deanei]|uniref:Acetyl-coenzyme A transporter 1, putative n=1 Tax=Angomonas deanei TaxID=59799 RepID=A0A7G2CFT9_9TRYP|nr:Acetyl-coenzyme A transporter 1, putative [Angomonas deanei]
MTEHALHFGIIIFLYFCQGIVQGTLAIVVLILLQRHPDLSVADQATLGLPMYSFSFKFLWAPLIDRVYCRHGCFGRLLLHRRAQWVLILQALMSICYMTLFFGGDNFLESVVSSRKAFFQFWVVLAILAFLNASQDVAVDAWAVEGLPKSEAAAAGVLQLVGTVTGVCISNFFVELNSWDATKYSVEMFCLTAGIVCVAAGVSAMLLSCYRRLPNEDAPCEECEETLAKDGKGVLETLRDVCRSHGLRELVVIFFTRAWPMATWFLVVSRLISMGVLTAGEFAQYRIYSMLIQLFLGTFFARRVLRYTHAASVLQMVSGVDFVISAAFSVCFVFVADPSVRRWYGPLVVLPALILVTAFSAFSFVAGVELCSGQAHRFPRDVGGVLSLLNALSNIGHHVPSTLCLYSARLVELLFRFFLKRDVSYVDYYHNDGKATHTASYEPFIIKSDVILLSILFFSVSLILRYKYLLPAAQFLQVSSAEELAPIMDTPSNGNAPNNEV